MAIEIEMVPAEYNYLFEDREPEEFWPEIKRPAGDFFTYEELIEFLALSPANLVSCLRKHRDIIKIYSSILNQKDRDWFYNNSIDPVECLYTFHEAKFHYIEVRELRNALLAEQQVLDESRVQERVGLKEDLAKKNTRIAELELEFATARQRIAELEIQLATAKEAPTTPACVCKGLPSVVCQMRRSGKSEKEIAESLSDKGQGCSNPQIGALVHPTAQIGYTTPDALTKYAQRLLGKA
jgi:hypothetical protein